MRFNINKIILAFLMSIIFLYVSIVCWALVLVSDYKDYKESANEEIIRLQNEISDVKKRMSKTEEQLKTLEEMYEQADKDEEIKTDTTVKSKSLFYLSDYQRQIVECIVMGESGGEPYDGQVAVAQCILNACLKDGLQPSEVRTKYKYSGWNTNPTESVKKAVKAVFDEGYKVTDKYIMYFYAPKYSKGSWHETQQFVMEIGGHRFFAEK